MFVKFPAIEHLKHISKDLVGKDEVVFSGKVKLHGTNSGIGYDRLTDTWWVQSRNQVLFLKRITTALLLGLMRIRSIG